MPVKPSIVRRLVARIIDGGVLAVVAVAAGRPLGFATGWLVVTAVGVYGYFVVCDAVWGSTLGKRIVALRLVDVDGNRPTIGASAAREAFTLLGAVPFAGPVLSTVAGIAIGVGAGRDADGRGVHDRLAGGTRVTLR
jgi:uncharacterized RDD family membrane protein YckC